MNPAQPSGLVENFFRHESGRLVALLTRRFGPRHLQAIEDAVQSALLRALDAWTRDGLPASNGLPASPDAWLTRVATNALLGELRRERRHQDALGERLDEYTTGERDATAPEPTLQDGMSDDLLYMLFVCCDARIPIESQLVLALKTLCGFDTREIAQRLLTTEANVYKRHARALERLREGDNASRLRHPEQAAPSKPQTEPVESANSCELNGADKASFEIDSTTLPRRIKNSDTADEPYGINTDLTEAELRERLPAVHLVLYLILTEGYLSAQPDTAIRAELCNEAIRLATHLAEHPIGQTPETYALLALMHLQTARLPGRTNDAGDLLLLEEQDRTKWNRAQIAIGLQLLDQSSTGDTFSRYHAEAGVAAEHAIAASYRETRWDRIVDSYTLLTHQAPSPIHTLNHAVALAELQGPAAGLALLAELNDAPRVTDSYLYAAVLADLHHRAGDLKQAATFRATALAKAPSEAIRALLHRRLKWLERPANDDSNA